MEEDNMEIELLLTEPRNAEYHLEALGGVFDHSSEVQDDSAVYWSDGTEVQEDEVDGFLEPSVFGSFLPWGNLLHGPRGTRRRRKSWKGEVSHQFASQYPCISGGRKNNDHWSHDEVMKLVDGISTYGVGNWTKVKDAHFSTSIRETTHLKDKWRNLVRTCTKEEPTMYLHLEQSVIDRIREIHAKYPYPRQSRS